MQPQNTSPTEQPTVTNPGNQKAQITNPQSSTVIQPSTSAQSRHGFDNLDTTKKQKRAPLLYFSAIASYLAIVLSLLSFNSVAIYSYGGVLAGGIAGLAGYRMGNKKLAIFGYIAFGINAVILLITQFIG